MVAATPAQCFTPFHNFFKCIDISDTVLLLFSVTLITQWVQLGNPSCSGIFEVIMDWPEGKDFGISSSEEVTHAEEAPLHNKLPENEKQCALLTAVVLWGSIRGGRLLYGDLQDMSQTAEEGQWSQFTEVRAIQLALGTAEGHEWAVLHLSTDTWMVTNALWGWLQQWQQKNWQCRGKPIWAAALWKDTAAWVGNLAVNVHHVYACVPKNWAALKKQPAGGSGC